MSLLNPLPVARDVYRAEALPQSAAGYRRDTITLGWEERSKTRARRVSDAGFEFGTVLPRGTLLRAGDCLIADDSKTIITVMEREEAVLVVEPASQTESSVFAYHIGNSHQPMMLHGTAIVCPDLPGVRQVLEYHRISFSQARRPFTPLGLVPDHRH